MRQITINIPDGKFDMFMQLLKNLPFIKIANEKKLASTSVKKRDFTVVKVSDKKFRFNREEANER